MIDQDHPALRDYLETLECVPEVFRRSWDAIAIYDLEGRLVAGNAAARALVGEMLASTLPGQHFNTHMALEEATAAARAFAQVARTGDTYDGDSAFRASDGTPIPVRMRLVAARSGGKIVGVVGFARDIRLQRAVEAQFMRSEQQFRSLFENHPDALGIHDLQGRFVRVNAGEVNLTGYSVEELVGQTPAMLAPGGQWQDGGRIAAAIVRGESIEFSHSIVTKSGDHREVEGRAVPLRVDGVVRGFCGMVHDVTDERRRDRESARQAERISELYRIAAAAGILPEEKVASALDAGMRELRSDWAYVGRLDGGVMELIFTAGESPGAFPVGTTIEIARAVIRHALETQDIFFAEDLSEPEYGEDLAGARSVWRSFVGIPLVLDGEQYGAVGFTTSLRIMHLSATDRDYIRALAALIGSAVQQSQREKRLDTLAFHDSLTGLPNRALLQDRLEQTLLSARRHYRSFATHYIDIDHFKSINDTFGHQVGDQVLIATAAWLRNTLRDSDTIARFGGDEFVILQPEIESQRQAEDLAAKLVAIRDKIFEIGGHTIRVTISVGGAVFPADGENPVDMLRAADAKLYEVKNGGRDGFSVGTVR